MMNPTVVLGADELSVLPELVEVEELPHAVSPRNATTGTASRRTFLRMDAGWR